MTIDKVAELDRISVEEKVARAVSISGYD